MDYIANIGGSLTGSVLFASSTNYFISGQVYCNGAVTVEPTVFKCAVGAFIELNSTLTLRNVGPYRPVICTGVDDDTVGQSLTNYPGSGYTGVINTNGYACPALYMGTTSLSITNFRFCYAQSAVCYPTAAGASATVTLSHCQLVNCIRGILLCCGGGCGCGCGSGCGSGCGCGCGGCGSVTVTLNNTLLAGAQYPFWFGGVGNPVGVAATHCTLANGSALLGGSWSGFVGPFTSTNCTYAALGLPASGWGGVGACNGFYNASPAFGASQFAASAWPFQSVGAGNFYLTDASGWRGVGATSGVPAAVLAALAKRTTYPPLVTANAVLTMSQTLWPQAARNTGPPDLIRFPKLFTAERSEPRERSGARR